MTVTNFPQLSQTPLNGVEVVKLYSTKLKVFQKTGVGKGFRTDLGKYSEDLSNPLMKAVEGSKGKMQGENGA